MALTNLARVSANWSCFPQDIGSHSALLMYELTMKFIFSFVISSRSMAAIDSKEVGSLK
jgi:hypothetical protein